MGNTTKKLRRHIEKLKLKSENLFRKTENKIEAPKDLTAKKESLPPEERKRIEERERLEKLELKTIQGLRLAEMMQLPEFTYLKKQTPEEFKAELEKASFQAQLKENGIETTTDLPIVLNETTRQRAIRALNMSGDIERAVAQPEGTEKNLLITPPKGRGGEVVAQIEKHPILAVGCLTLGLFAMFKLVKAAKNKELGSLFVGLGASGMAAFMGLSLFGKKEMAKAWIIEKVNKISKNKVALKEFELSAKKEVLKGIDELFGDNEMVKSAMKLFGLGKIVEAVKEKAKGSVDKAKELVDTLKDKAENKKPSEENTSSDKPLAETIPSVDSPKPEEAPISPPHEAGTNKATSFSQEKYPEESLGKREKLERRIEKIRNQIANLREQYEKIRKDLITDLKKGDPDFQKAQEKYNTKWHDIVTLYEKYRVKINRWQRFVDKDNEDIDIDAGFSSSMGLKNINKFEARISFVKKFEKNDVLKKVNQIENQLKKLLEEQEQLEEKIGQQEDEKTFAELKKKYEVAPKSFNLPASIQHFVKESKEKLSSGEIKLDELGNVLADRFSREETGIDAIDLFLYKGIPYIYNAGIKKLCNVESWIRFQYGDAILETIEGTYDFSQQHRKKLLEKPIATITRGFIGNMIAQTARFAPLYAAKEVIFGKGNILFRGVKGATKSWKWAWDIPRGYYKIIKGGTEIGKNIAGKTTKNLITKKTEKTIIKNAILKFGEKAISGGTLRLVGGIGLVWMAYDLGKFSESLRKGAVEEIFGQGGKILSEEIEKKRILFQAVGSGGLYGLGEASGIDFNPFYESMRKEGTLREAINLANMRILKINKKNPLEPIPLFSIPSDLEKFERSSNTASGDISIPSSIH